MCKEKGFDSQMLCKKAIEVRRDILKMLAEAGSGHTGGSLSIVEILLVLYYYKMRHSPTDPNWPQRDRFILSKGHGCPALYAVLADVGYFPKDELMTLRKLGSRLQGHPQIGLPGIEISSGSLGQGLSIANGIALAAKMDGLNIKVYCLMGDGEMNEGQIWEAVMTASHYKLDNLCGIVDVNRLQIDGFCCNVKNMEPINKKWESFGWKAIDVDGHNFSELKDAFDKADLIKERPTVLLCCTIKGKGVSFMENDPRWHGIAPNKDELLKALEELDRYEREISTN